MPNKTSGLGSFSSLPQIYGWWKKSCTGWDGKYQIFYFFKEWFVHYLYINWCRISSINGMICQHSSTRLMILSFPLRRWRWSKFLASLAWQWKKSVRILQGRAIWIHPRKTNMEPKTWTPAKGDAFFGNYHFPGFMLVFGYSRLPGNVIVFILGMFFHSRLKLPDTWRSEFTHQAAWTHVWRFERAYWFFFEGLHNHYLGGCFKDFLFSSLPGEMIQFD